MAWCVPGEADGKCAAQLWLHRLRHAGGRGRGRVALSVTMNGQQFLSPINFTFHGEPELHDLSFERPTRGSRWSS